MRLSRRTSGGKKRQASSDGPASSVSSCVVPPSSAPRAGLMDDDVQMVINTPPINSTEQVGASCWEVRVRGGPGGGEVGSVGFRAASTEDVVEYGQGWSTGKHDRGDTGKGGP